MSKRLMDDPFHKERFPIGTPAPDGAMIVLYWCRENKDDDGGLTVTPLSYADADTLKAAHFMHERDAAIMAAEFARKIEVEREAAGQR